MVKEYTREEKLKFKELVNCLHEKYNRKCNWLIETSWWNTLNQFDYEEIKQAILQYCSNSPFMPQESEIAGIINGKSKKKNLPVWSNDDELRLRELQKQYLEAVKGKNLVEMNSISAKTSALELIKSGAVG